MVPPTPILDAIERETKAFAEGYTLGYGAGREIGYVQGEKAADDLWLDGLGIARRVGSQSSHTELACRRQHIDEACSANCGRCSRCVRAGWVARHGGDYPGGRRAVA